MLREGLLRIMAQKTISKITISELCKESGLNRTTFYNHYDSPTMVLKDIAEDYAERIREIYFNNHINQKRSESESLEACFEYLYTKKQEIRVLLSKNSENRISGFCLGIVEDSLKKDRDMLFKNSPGDSDDAYLSAVISASAAFGLIQVWLTTDMDKTPREVVDLLMGALGGRFFV